MAFRVIPPSVPASAEEWRRAVNAPASELPQLSESQLAEVKQFSLNEEEYKRLRVLLRRYAEERQTRQGLKLGDLIESMIAPFGSHYALSTVSRRGTPLGWRVTIHHDQKGVYEFQCPLEMVHALTDGAVSKDQVETLRGQVLRELGEEAMLGAAS